MTQHKLIEKEFTWTTGKKRGTTIETAPEFNWDEFKKLPLTREYVSKQFDSELQKLVREINTNEHGTNRNHLKSMSAVCARSLNFTKEQIENWLNTRNWSVIKDVAKDPIAAERIIRKRLLEMKANRDASSWEPEQQKKTADLIALLADKPEDVYADWLFEKFANDDESSSSLMDF